MRKDGIRGISIIPTKTMKMKVRGVRPFRMKRASPRPVTIIFMMLRPLKNMQVRQDIKKENFSEQKMGSRLFQKRWALAESSIFIQCRV